MDHVRTTFFLFASLYATVPACAAIDVLPPGQLVPTAAENLVTFDQITAQAYGTTNPTGPFAAGGATFSGSGLVMRNGEDGSLPALGLYAEPYHDKTNYMAVLGNGSETVAFTSMRKTFGLYWGSIDSYNSIAFFSMGRLVASFTGADLAPLLPIPFGNQTSDGSNRYVQFSGIGGFDTVVLASGGNSFEFDNVVSSVPEVRTWLLMLLGSTGLAMLRIKPLRATAAKVLGA